MSTITLDLAAGPIALPPPALDPALSLRSALLARRSTRAFLPDPLPLARLSDILWSAFGVNRPQSGGRTAPSAHDWREMTLLAVLPEGTWRYDAREHRLLLVKTEDLRRLTGVQDFVAKAPLNLVYVADLERMHDVRPQDLDFFAGADAGCIAQNVYLYCAAIGLGSVVRGLVDRRSLAHALGLPPTQRIALAQTIGYPAPQ